MKRAFMASTAFFLALFALGFVLGTIRVLLVAPQVGPFAATLAEVPVMLIAAFFGCRGAVRYWQVPPNYAARWFMVVWFLLLLIAFETLLGATLFERTMADQWAALATPTGVIGVSAQIIAALLPVFVGMQERRRP